jgi:AcrR family transcriptional regulator
MTTARRPPGKALQDDVTEAIAKAFFEELAETGYGRLSVDAVARRAGVGKAAVYRRWPSKQRMAIELTSSVANAAIDTPDTGNLRDDVKQYLVNAHAALSHPLARMIIPDLLAEANRDSELATAMLTTVRDPRRAKAAELVTKAIARGELPGDTDVDLCLDLLAGPLYWRMSAIHTELGADYLDRLADKVVAAFKA